MTKQIKFKSNSAQVIFDAAIKKGLKVYIFSKRFNLFEISNGIKSHFVKGTSFHVNSQPSCIIANNKFLTKKILKKDKISTPKSWLAKSVKEIRNIVDEYNLFPCVIKPTKGAHGNSVYANIETKDELEYVLVKLFNGKKRKDYLVEEYIEGKDYRLLVVGDSVAAAMQRIPAHVVGDGTNTIRQLITQFNQQPQVGQKYEKPMCKIRLNGEVMRTLKKQKLKLTYIPQKNEVIYLRSNANISTGGIGRDVTEEISPEIRKIAIQATKAIGMKIAGVDIIYDERVNKPYVLEINDQPGIDIHHYPVSGKSRDVADCIINYFYE